MNTFRFLDWQVYKNSKELFSVILELINKMPREYRFELGSQIIRCAFSVILNIAEGSAKKSDKELNRYMDISLGSLNELLAAVDVLMSTGFINKQEFSIIQLKAESIAKQLGGFKRYISRNQIKS